MVILVIQSNFGGSNTDGSLTTAVSNSFLSPQEKIPWLQIRANLMCSSFFILTTEYCVYSLESLH